MKRTVINKILLVILILIIIAAVITISANLFTLFSTGSRIYSLEDEIPYDDYDCILVLGAGVKQDGTPSNMLEDRILTGISLYEKELSAKLLMSGDHNKSSYDEVNAMLEYAVNKGVSPEVIFLDHAGLCTYDSIYRLKHIFGFDKVIIVTQKYHLYRAIMIADALGVEAIGVSADLRPYTNQWIRDIREVVARTKDSFSAIFKPEAAIMGDPINTDCGASVTHDR